MRPIAEMSDAQIDNQIANHERLKQTGSPRYRELLEARGQRAGFDFNTSLVLIERSARERRLLSYGELAEASGVEWSRAYRLLGSHLWDIVKYSYDKDGLILSAIVVNKETRASGDMKEDALKGFVGAARALGEPVLNLETFLKEQQDKVFAHYARQEA